MAKHFKRGETLELITSSCVLLLMLGVAVSFFPLMLNEMGSFLVVKDAIRKADVIVALGGGKGAERVWFAIQLYKQGYARRLLFTGEQMITPDGILTTWPQMAQKEAIAQGVPKEDIILEERSTSTYDDACYSLEDLKRRGFKKAIVVSDPFHMRRARLTFFNVFEEERIQLYFIPASTSSYSLERWWTREEDFLIVIEEYIKMFYYLCKGRLL